MRRPLAIALLVVPAAIAAIPVGPAPCTVGPAQGAVGPVQGTVEPAQGAVEPVQGTVEPVQGTGALERALRNAELALGNDNPERARELLDRALERDAKSTAVWALVARWARAAGDPDEEVYALHRRYALARAQGAGRDELAAFWGEVEAIDPLAPVLGELRDDFVERLEDVAARYEKNGRYHSAIAVHKEILALDADRASSQAAIERIAAAPDPSLAEFAKPRDLFADVSEEEIAAFDDEHGTWDERGRLERENYVTHTNAGYRVLHIAAEAMEQMNAFYREFFQYGTEDDGRSVPRIALHIFATRDEYLELGIGPPVEWSGGHFTGNAVETYVSGGDPKQMFGTLFHEAAHQFVSLATNAAGWLNEGLASFFEGCRILPNGTVEMNAPADHRLIPLADRMEVGWMASWDDGWDPEKSDSVPKRAPTFRIIVENRYPWGPAWYAPTWGIVFFLYNYQDSFDGRFVYRDAFRVFVDSSGGRMGEGAVDNFVETVLQNPRPPIAGLERPEDAPVVALPETVEELDVVWRQWTLDLREERLGRLEVERPYLDWARYAALDENPTAAQEHFEKALLAEPESAAVRYEFARLLHGELDASDRAAQLLREALLVLEGTEPVDTDRVREAERLLVKADPRQRSLEALHAELLEGIRDLVGRYAEAQRPKMVMHLAWRFGLELGDPELFERYAEAARTSGKSLLTWRLAYNESDMEGWTPSGSEPAFRPSGAVLDAGWSDYRPGNFDYQFLTLDQLTAGDYSFEAEVQANRGDVAFAGLVFGRKGASDFHALAFFPGKADSPNAYVDLASFFGGGNPRTWRHVPVPYTEQVSPTSSGRWYRLRIDVTGRWCDLWVDGKYLGTQDFGSRGVVSGELGLVVGSGRARFQNVRFRTGHPRDPAARIERDVRLEAALAVRAEATDGSYLGRVPPWPRVERWLQGERRSWQDVGRVPQLVVFWSRDQNEVLPLDGWLRELSQKHEGVGLRIVSVCSPNDSEGADEYLAEHAFPDAVAVDAREGEGIGETFTAFAIDRFHLPRVLLLDTDGRVVWEGEPGYERAAPWEPGAWSFVDDPLEDLVVRRRLRELRAWLAAWDEAGGRATLRSGRAADLLPLLSETRALDGDLATEVLDAQRALEALEAALADLPAAGRSIATQGAEPALEVLLAWGQALEVEPDRAARRELKEFLEARSVRQWATVLKACDRYLEKARPGSEAQAAGALMDVAGRMGRLFVLELRADLEAARAAEDWERLGALCRGARERPARWLASTWFGW